MSHEKQIGVAAEPPVVTPEKAGALMEIVDPPTFTFGNERTVVVTQLPHVIVSTVRLSIDHGHGGVPLWFETMVFPHDGADITEWGELDADRYTTEQEARAGHDTIVERWRARPVATPIWEDDDGSDPA